MPRGQPRGQQQPVETPAAVIASPAVLEPESKDPLQRNRNVQAMPEAELRAYALQIGVYPGDAQRLDVERLRQNCLIRLYDVIAEH
jgi:hypothetical protein